MAEERTQAGRRARTGGEIEPWADGCRFWPFSEHGCRALPLRGIGLTVRLTSQACTSPFRTEPLFQAGSRVPDRPARFLFCPRPPRKQRRSAPRTILCARASRLVRFG